MPAPRCPFLCSGLFSMIRTDMPFCKSVSASTSPEGPAPTCDRMSPEHRQKMVGSTHNKNFGLSRGADHMYNVRSGVCRTRGTLGLWGRGDERCQREKASRPGVYTERKRKCALLPVLAEGRLYQTAGKAQKLPQVSGPMPHHSWIGLVKV